MSQPPGQHPDPSGGQPGQPGGQQWNQPPAQQAGQPGQQPQGNPGPQHTQPLPQQGGWQPQQGQAPGQGQWGGPQGPGGPGGYQGGPGGSSGPKKSRTKLFVILGVAAVLVIGGIIAAVLLLGGGDGASSDDPVDTVDNFIEAVEDGDCPAAQDLLTDKAREDTDCDGDSFPTDDEIPAGIEFGDAEEESKDGDKATVIVPMSGEADGETVPDGANQTFEMVKEDGKWLIDEFGVGVDGGGETTEVPTDIPTDIPTDDLSDIPTEIPTDDLTDIPTDLGTTFDPSELLSELSELTELTDVPTE